MVWKGFKMMLSNLDDQINGFCKNKKINSIQLYLVKDISDLYSSDLITNDQKKFFYLIKFIVINLSL